MRRSNSRFDSPSFSQRDASRADLAHLALWRPNQLLAKVGAVELRSEDLGEIFENKFQGGVSHAGLSAQDIAHKAGQAIDELIEDELLAQAARGRGLKTDLTGNAARCELARKYLELNAATLPDISDLEIRSFYKNHREKFNIPPGARVRELFLPLQGTAAEQHKSRPKVNDESYLLGERLAARIRNGESLEPLAKQHVPEVYRERAQVREFRGAVMNPEDESNILALRSSEVVGPLRVEGGYSIFQVVAQIRSGMLPFHNAKEKIRAFLASRRIQETRKQLIAQLRQKNPVQRFESGRPEETMASARVEHRPRLARADSKESKAGISLP